MSGEEPVDRREVVIELAPAVVEIDQELIRRIVAATRERFEGDLGPARGDVRVRIYPGRSRLEPARHASVLGSPEWSAGVFDGALRLFVVRERPPEPRVLAALVAHELTHLLVARITQGRCPAWLDEGLAIRYSQPLPRAFEAVLRDAASRDRTLPLELLERPFQDLGDARLIDLAYAQAASVVGFLCERLGPAAMARMVRAMATRRPDESLGAEGWPYARLEQEWTHSLRPRGASP